MGSPSLRRKSSDGSLCCFYEGSTLHSFNGDYNDD